MNLLISVLLLLCISVAALGCSADSDSTTDGGGNAVQTSAEDADSGTRGRSFSSGEDADSIKASSRNGSDDDTVSRQNPGFSGTVFHSIRNDALVGAEPLDVVSWTVPPSIFAGALGCVVKSL